MTIRLPLIAAVFLVAACETVPSTLDPTVFATQMDAVSENPSVFASNAELTALLMRDDLTPEQRADALYSRAETRFEGRFDLPGALEDYDAFLALVPEDPRSAAVERRRVFAATEIENAQRRLARLQNLPDWFDDKVLMGEFEVAVARYRKAGLTPNNAQLYLLREAGLVCTRSGETDETQVVDQFGYVPDYAVDAIWCPDPSVS